MGGGVQGALSRWGVTGVWWGIGVVTYVLTLFSRVGNGSWDGDTLSLFHLPFNNILYPGSLWFSLGRGRTMGRLVRCACNSPSSPQAGTSCQAPLRACRDVPGCGRCVYFCCPLRTGLVGVLFPGGGSRPDYVRGCDRVVSVSGVPFPKHIAPRDGLREVEPWRARECTWRGRHRLSVFVR